MNPIENKNTSRSKPELTRAQKLARRFLPVLALSLTAAGYGGAKLHDKLEYREVGTITTTVDQGETPIDAVSEAVTELAAKHGFEVNEVAGITRAGQEVSGEIQDETGESVIQPGAAIEATVLKNGFGRYKVEADPASDDR